MEIYLRESSRTIENMVCRIQTLRNIELKHCFAGFGIEMVNSKSVTLQLWVKGNLFLRYNPASENSFTVKQGSKNLSSDAIGTDKSGSEI